MFLKRIVLKIGNNSFNKFFSRERERERERESCEKGKEIKWFNAILRYGGPYVYIL